MKSSLQTTERINTVVIGGGQAGLATGYHLKKRNIPFMILEANNRIGDSWRRRWDSLRLFTPAIYDGIDGMPFPAPPYSFPTKDEMADYLESYAAHFSLPVRTDVRVERLSKCEGKFELRTNTGTIVADNVIVAMANYQKPRVPAFARELDPGIVQLHSRDYRNPSQLQDGPVLIVGAGNSGAEIGVEVARTHKTWMSGRDVGHIPFNIAGLAARLLLIHVVLRLLFHRVLTLNTPVGRKARPKIVSRGGPLIRTKNEHLQAASIDRVSRMAGVRDGRPLLDDGTVLDVANVIWCTGFHPGFSWIDIPGLNTQEPEHERGVVAGVQGLYFVGLHFLYAFSSTMIHGVSRDAEYIVEHIATTSTR